MSILTLPNANHPQNGDDLDADVVRAQITQLLQYLQALDLSNAITGSLGSGAFDQNTNPTLFRQDLISSFISAGGLPGGFTLLTLTVPSITSAYFASTGTRLGLTSGAGFTVAINQDTYFSLSSNGSINTPQGVANGAAQPTLPANSQWLFRAISNGTTITSIIDMRTLHGITPAVIHNPAKFLVYRNAALNTSASPVLFDAKVHDIGNNYDPATGKFTVTIPGFYIFSGLLTPNFASAGRAIGVNFAKNGTVLIPQVFVSTYTGTFSEAQAQTTPPLQLIAGDYIQIISTNTSGDAYVVGSSPLSTYFSGYLLSHT